MGTGRVMFTLKLVMPTSYVTCHWGQNSERRGPPWGVTFQGLEGRNSELIKRTLHSEGKSRVG